MFHVPNQHRIRKQHLVKDSTGKIENLGTDKSYGNNGLFMFWFNGYEVLCQVSDGLDWEHVSVTINRQRTPTWEVMNHVKDLFWDEEDIVIQFHPPKSQYVNRHPFCLHLWRPIGTILPLPDPKMVG